MKMKCRRKFSQHETTLAQFFVYIVIPGCLHSVYEIIIMERHSCAGRNLIRLEIVSRNGAAIAAALAPLLLCVKRFSAFRSFFFGGAKKNNKTFCVNPFLRLSFFLKKRRWWSVRHRPRDKNSRLH